MSSSQVSRWFAVMLLVGCNAKLQVDPAATGGSGGVGGKGVAGAVGAGRGPIDEQAGDNSGGSDTGGGGDDNAGGYAGAFCYPIACGGSGGAQVVEPMRGQHGQPCIPGGSSVEADGNPGKTSITTLDRCDNGLACDVTKHCTGMPACPQSTGQCLVYGVPQEDPGVGGSGGSAGSGSFGGAGTVAAEAGVMALAVDDTHLYWIQYGTRDALGNYQNDGTLRSYGLVDAKIATLASSLPGPNALGVTSEHAYIAVDGGTLIGSAAHAQLLRLPLTGGATELVQDAVSPIAFASVGDQAFWQSTSGVYTILPAPAATVNNLFSGYSQQVAADASNLYLNSNSGIVSLPLVGATPNLVISPGYTFALGGDSVYGIETQDSAVGMILDVVPKTGGAWTRKRALGAGDYADRLQIIGDRYVFSASPPFPPGGSTIGANVTKEYLETGLISSTAAPLRLVEATGFPYNGTQRMPWVATAEAVFWSDRSAIFSRSVTGK